MPEQIVYNGKPHWMAYANSIVRNFAIIIGGGLLLSFVCSILLPAKLMALQMKFPGMILLVFLLKTLLDCLQLTSVKIVLDTEKVHYYSGYLGWQKTRHGWNYEQFFECSYKHTFLGNIFGYGTLILAEADGIRTTITVPFFDSPVTFCNTFEKMKRELKIQYAPVMNTASDLGNSSFVEQLEKLIAMKESGHISEEEFEVMKQRL